MTMPCSLHPHPRRDQNMTCTAVAADLVFGLPYGTSPYGPSLVRKFSIRKRKSAGHRPAQSEIAESFLSQLTWPEDCPGGWCPVAPVGLSAMGAEP
jgi:hypothetical protein